MPLVVRRIADLAGVLLIVAVGMLLSQGYAATTIAAQFADDIMKVGTVVLVLAVMLSIRPRERVLRTLTTVLTLVVIGGMVIIMHVLPLVFVLTVCAYLLFLSGASLQIWRVAGTVAVVGITIFTPVPGLVFGEPSVEPGGVTRLSIAFLTVLICLMSEFALHVYQLLLHERTRTADFAGTIENLTRVNVGFQQYSRDVEVRSKQEE